MMTPLTDNFTINVQSVAQYTNYTVAECDINYQVIGIKKYTNKAITSIALKS
jgi:hypothetical protein